MLLKNIYVSLVLKNLLLINSLVMLMPYVEFYRYEDPKLKTVGVEVESVPRVGEAIRLFNKRYRVNDVIHIIGYGNEEGVDEGEHPFYANLGKRGKIEIYLEYIEDEIEDLKKTPGETK